MASDIQKNWFGISQKLLMLTVAFVMLAEVLVYIPSIAQFRNSWLGDRLAAARVAALVIEAAPPQSMPETTVQQMLELLQAKTITLKMGGKRRLLGFSDMPPMIEREFDLRNPGIVTSITESFDTLINGGARTVNIIGSAPMGGDFVDIVIDEMPLRQAMLDYSVNILLISLIISATTSTLLYIALRYIILAPTSRIVASINNFAVNPESDGLSLKSFTSNDELGSAEQALYEMQAVVANQFKEKQRLAALGLAVSKINHDLRNMLASVQLFSDRLGSLPDPTVQRLAPKLTAALDRAIQFCETTLAFGKAGESLPVPKCIKLQPLVDDVRNMLGANNVEWQINIPHDFTVYADQEHLFRIFVNLGRNAVEAIKNVKDARIRVAAIKRGAFVDIDVADNGCGIPENIKSKLFQAFNGSNKFGSSGLGLTISAELTKANGGDIQFIETKTGACFRITLPDRAIEFSSRPYQNS